MAGDQQRPVSGPGTLAPLRRVRKAYEQIADQLRELIITGDLAPGQRLPTEAVLAREFGVSRATVREALRILAAQHLIRTGKGAGGGSYVTVPTFDHVSEFLRSNIALLSRTEDVSLAEFLEAREELEVPAARLAARRRADEDLHRLRGAVLGEHETGRSVDERFALNRRFHTTVLEAAGNRLMLVAAQPIFYVLQTNLARAGLDDAFHRGVDEHHRAITQAIEEGDEAAAERHMLDHLEWLRPTYERVWRHAREAPQRD